MKKWKLLIVTALINAPIVSLAAISCNQPSQNSKTTSSDNNSIDSITRNKIQSAQELIQLNNETKTQVQELIKSENAHGDIFDLLNQVKGNESSILTTVEQIIVKLDNDAAQAKTKFHEALPEFSKILFNKLDDIVEDVKEISSSMDFTPFDNADNELSAYIKSLEQNSREVNGQPTRTFIDNSLNNLNQAITNTYFDVNYYDKEQKDAQIDALLNDGHHHDHDDKTAEEEHHHSHSFGNIIYTAYLNLKLLAAKANVDNIIAKLTQLDEEHKMTSLIETLKNQLNTLIGQINQYQIDKNDTIFERFRKFQEDLSNLLKKNAQENGITLRETKTNLADANV
ncbi:hypothetical protein [Mycoplasmopsis sturni]|uniref:hypothetical protein n=1 Tax=Mycoplasmopsis sturni TaxID=39047 RepID=UPI0005682150|nr:hypothetical protein [Mycoplasmopsis sturni]